VKQDTSTLVHMLNMASPSKIETFTCKQQIKFSIINRNYTPLWRQPIL